MPPPVDTNTPPPATMSSFSSTNAPSFDGNLGITLGVVISTAVALITIIIIVIIILIRIVQRRSQRLLNYSNTYEELSKPDPPPIPAQFPSLSVSDVEPYATVNATGARQVPNSDTKQRGNAVYGLKAACTDFTKGRQNEVRQVPTEIHLNGNAAYGSNPANFVGVTQSELHQLQDNLKAACSEDSDQILPQYQEHLFGTSNLHELQDTLEAACSEDPDPMTPEYQEHIFSGSNPEWQEGDSESTHAQFLLNVEMNENMAYGLNHLTNETADSDTTDHNQEEQDPEGDQSTSAAN